MFIGWLTIANLQVYFNFHVNTITITEDNIIPIKTEEAHSFVQHVKDVQNKLK